MIAGSNCEITTRLTLARRPGSSVYNSQTFAAINRFYEFRQFTGSSETISVIADTAASIYNATGPSTKTLLFTKSAGSGQSYFQGVGNTLYWGDGIDQEKYVVQPQWQALTSYPTGANIVDSNGNLQQVLEGSIEVSQIPMIGGNVIVNANILYLKIPTLGVPPSTYVGQTATFASFVGASFINGLSKVCQKAYLQYLGGGGTVTVLTFNLTHANYGPATDTGLVGIPGTPGTSGGSAPAWSSTFGAATGDGTLIWICKGSQVQPWGIQPPTIAPSASNIVGAGNGVWAAHTYYWPSLVLVDPIANLQILTTAGTTAAAPPVFAISGTTNDGTAVWTFLQTGSGWSGTTSYTAGSYVVHTFTSIYGPRSVVMLYQAQTGGTSGSTTPNFNSTLGSLTVDNNITWVCLGDTAFRLNVAAGTVGGSIGNTDVLTLNSFIQDSNGSREDPIFGGDSGALVPTWATTLGGLTFEAAPSELVWSNGGPLGGSFPWKYGYAFKNSVTSEVSSMSPFSSPVTLVPGAAISVSGVGDPNSPTDGVDTIEIYRTTQGGSIPLFLADIAWTSGSWSYLDTTPDSGLNTTIQGAQNFANNPPPVGLINLTYHLGRIFGSVKNTVYYSNAPLASPGSSVSQFPPANSFVFPSSVTRMVPTAVGLLVFTVSDIYIITGEGIAGLSPLISSPLLAGIGVTSYNAIDINGSLIYAYTTQGQFISLDPAGVTEIGFPIGDILQTLTSSAVYVTWHAGSSSDKAVYIADGSTGWYRLNPVPSPETGFAWSPKAAIVGGVKAVQSVEVSPGVKKLLLGPTSSGPILQRDATVNTDNGSTFTWNATIGSIILAHPGQLAEVSYITAELLNSLSVAPTISVLLDEISGQSGSPAFSALTNIGADPTQFPASASLISNRYVFSKLALPAWCRHMQVNISFPAENAAEEVLTYTVVGAHWDEHS